MTLKILHLFSIIFQSQINAETFIFYNFFKILSEKNFLIKINKRTLHNSWFTFSWKVLVETNEEL